MRGQFDDDPYSLPSGVQRIAYDSDSRRYTFRDAEGRVYLGNVGEEYTSFENSITARETRRMFNSEDFHEYNPQHSKLQTFSDILPSAALTSAPPPVDPRDKHNRSPSKLASVARKLTMKSKKDSKMHGVVQHAMQDQGRRHSESRAYGDGGGRGDYGGRGDHGPPMMKSRTAPAVPSRSMDSNDPFSDANAVAVHPAAGVRYPHGSAHAPPLPPMPSDYHRHGGYAGGEYRD
ncbi:hypothetical protein BD626DRAFT_484168 [Schizophyllum amplum]|uniref:Uncharacterized protein n=1 Tax=Schizophyllum amplum TaxID=97359 RepID=A0A550CQ26_9AGAR|nr:hypothetical protein BD626DRAFT_484168 [Auriculariopsis ampla]